MALPDLLYAKLQVEITMNFLSLIENKREGKILAPEQIQEFIREFTQSFPKS